MNEKSHRPANLPTSTTVDSASALSGRRRWQLLRAYPVRNARRVKAVILDLKGLFIKVGQLISVLTNFLPEDFRHELEGLQDRIPARPLAQIRGRLQAELGGTVNNRGDWGARHDR